MGVLDDKVAIVTGAASGIGQGIATRFARSDATVVVADIDDERGSTVADRLTGARFEHLDVTTEAGWAAVVDRTLADHGRVDVLVNCAGIGQGGPIPEMTLESWNGVIAVNQTSVFLGMRAVSQPMMDARSGSIVNISSADGMMGGAGQLGYIATKWAVRGMTKAAALDLGAFDIRVNSIHPGTIRTPMIDMAIEMGVDVEAIARRVAVIERMGTPDEVGALAEYLAGDDSKYCTGSEFVIDGGMTAGYKAELFFGGGA